MYNPNSRKVLANVTPTATTILLLVPQLKCNVTPHCPPDKINDNISCPDSKPNLYNLSAYYLHDLTQQLKSVIQVNFTSIR